MRAAEFEALITAHQSAVLCTARRLLGHGHDAQDAAQEVFLRLLTHHEQLRGDPGGWLYRVTVNVCHDHFRRRKPLCELAAQAADPAPGPETQMRARERERALREGMARLTERERAAIVLRDIEGFTSAEAGAILRIKAVTVRRHVYSARARLLGYLGGRV